MSARITKLHVAWAILVVFFAVATPAKTGADDTKDPLAVPDGGVLRGAGVAFDEASLLAFVRECEGSGETRDVLAFIGKLSSEDFTERDSASARLVKMGEVAVAELRRASKSGDAEVATRARNCLQAIEQRQQQTAAAVRQLGRAKAIVALKSLLKSKDAKIREMSAEALGSLGEAGKGSVPELLATLGDPVLRVRITACSSLSKMIGPDDLPAFLRIAKDRQPEKRAEAVCLLRMFPKHAKEVVPVLLEALRDENTEVREQAALSLGRFGSDDRVARALGEALKDKAPASPRGGLNVAQLAARSLGEFGGRAEPALPALFESARHASPDVRYCVIRALGKIGKSDKTLAPKLLPVLVGILKDKGTGESRASAASALGELGPGAKEAVPALREALLLRDPEDRKTASYIRMNCLTAVERLGAAADDAVPEVAAILSDMTLGNQERQAAAVALGCMGKKAQAALPVLREAMKDRDYLLRKAASDAVDRLQR